mmetsp:Transcript_29591/g.70387  ORF Transcript_29591/g.70387 Transcript_29591/m.70387 type:complete len:231 (+) Transcript_29591:348-1040(+)
MALCGCMEAFRGLSMVRAPSQALRNGTDLVRIRAKPRALSGRFAVNGHASIPLTGNAAPLLAFLQHRMATHRIEIGTRIGHVFMPHDSGCAQGSDSRLHLRQVDVTLLFLGCRRFLCLWTDGHSCGSHLHSSNLSACQLIQDLLHLQVAFLLQALWLHVIEGLLHHFIDKVCFLHLLRHLSHRARDLWDLDQVIHHGHELRALFQRSSYPQHGLLISELHLHRVDVGLCA